MEKKKRHKIFEVTIIISVVMLIVLICCVIAFNVISKGQSIRQQNPPITGMQNNQEDSIQEEKNDDVYIPETERIQEKQEPQVIEVPDIPEPEKKPDENKLEEKEETPTKPITIPNQLSDDDVFAAFNNTLIIGDSRTEGFRLYSGVKNATYFCMKAMTVDKIAAGKQITVGGTSVSVFDMLDAASYDKVILEVGLNELGWNHIESFLRDYGTLIDSVKEKQPNATIYLHAVLPVTKAKNDSDKVHNNTQIYWYNENIIKLAADKGVRFVNPASAVADAEGFLVTEATTDGVHLNAQYCKVWAKALAELI